MSILVFVEKEDNHFKKTSFEAISYAREIGNKTDTEVTCAVFGSIPEDQLKSLGRYGCHSVVHVNDPQLDVPMIREYAGVLSQLIEDLNPEFIVLAQSAIADPVAGITAVRTDSTLATNVVSVPEIDNEIRVDRSIYTGKAFEQIILQGKRIILSIKKNASGIQEYDAEAKINISDSKPEKEGTEVQLSGREKAKGDILLSEAEIVVSGGRGLKGPENWGMIEELADVLGAAKGCSKPVSDAGWRPHHEHVGQTGIKVSPNLYIAVGISGAIQHLAGVSSSKTILVINNDPEAPFFKAADYGVVGDAFKVIPSLIEEIRKHK